MNDEFYIGYLDKSPPHLARYTRQCLVGLALVLIGMMVGMAARQTPAEPGTFEYGVARSIEGVLHENPLPRVRITLAGGSSTNYLLVGAGKHGLPAWARGHDGQRVRFKGSRIQAGAVTLIEMNDPTSFEVLGPGTATVPGTAVERLGWVSFTGELVDTKCYFGVMRPAIGKVHRACAVRCLSGGVPPGLLLRDAEDNGVVVLLVGADDRPLVFDPQWAARRVRARGQLSVRDGLPQLVVAEFSLVPDDVE